MKKQRRRENTVPDAAFLLEEIAMQSLNTERERKTGKRMTAVTDSIVKAEELRRLVKEVKNCRRSTK